MLMDKVNTGIPGMDSILGGGIPKTQLSLITGTSGTGKTTFCCQFMHEGIKRFNDRGVYLSFEEPSESIKENVKEFGWDFGALEKSGRFSFLKYDPYHIEEVFDILESSIREIKATRVVIDSISALGLHIKDDSELRKMIFDLSMILRKLNCTSLLVSEIVPGTRGISRYGVEEFVADNVVVLYYERLQATFSRAIQVWKVRGSSHSEKLHPYRITKKGIEVYPEEEAFIKM
jgi:KaiC/GvpD/RAD55 family RecA-like ATPase